MSSKITDSEEFAPAIAMQAVRGAANASMAAGTAGLASSSRAAIGAEKSIAAQAVKNTGAYGPVANTDPSAVTKMAGWAGLVGLAPMGLMAVPFLNGIPSVAGRVIKGVGYVTGSQKVKDFGAARMENAAIRGGKFKILTEKRMGEYFPGLENSSALTSVSERFGGALRAVGLGSDTRIAGLESSRNKLLGKVAPNAARFESLLDNAGTHFSGNHAALFGQVKNDFANFRAAAASHNMALVDKARVSLAQNIGKLHQAVHGLEESPFSDRLSAEMLAPAGIPSRVMRFFSKAVPAPKDAKAATSNLLSEFEHLNHHASKAAIKESKKGFWDGIGKGTSGNFIGKRIAEMDSMHMAIYGAAAVSNIAMNVGSVHSIGSQVKQFEAIYEGLTGKKCTLWTVLAGDVPPVLKRSQSELRTGMLREGGFNAALTGLDAILFFAKHGSGAAVAAQMIAAPMQDTFKCEVPLVQMQQAMTEAQKKGAHLEPVNYAQLLQTAAPETIGKVKTTNSMFVRLCNQLSKEQWTPLKTLQAVNDNSINLLAAQIQQDMAEHGRKPKDTVPAPAMQPQVAEIPAPANLNIATANSNKPQKRIQVANAVHIPPSHSQSARIG